jgi:hypothetical protein
VHGPELSRVPLSGGSVSVRGEGFSAPCVDFEATVILGHTSYFPFQNFQDAKLAGPRPKLAYEESGGTPESIPFAAHAVRIYLRKVRDS